MSGSAEPPSLAGWLQTLAGWVCDHGSHMRSSVLEQYVDQYILGCDYTADKYVTGGKPTAATIGSIYTERYHLVRAPNSGYT